MPRILIEVGPGELVDRITILDLKARHLDGPDRERVAAELARLRDAATAAGIDLDAAGPVTDLATVNRRLWDVEDDIRAHEARGDFGPAFVALARRVIRLNDRRSSLKRALDRTFGAQPAEFKVYARPGGH